MDEKTLDEPPVEYAQPAASRTTAAHHSARSRSHRSGSNLHRVSRRLVLAIALSISLLVLILVIIFSTVHIGGLVNENDALKTELAQVRLELSQTGPELEQARKIVSEVTKGRLPHLLDLVPDKVLEVNTLYIKNIVFSVLNQNGTKNYEYKLVMENSTPRTVHPAARIFVFDRYGVQIGSAEVASRAGLDPGESRSQSSVIDRFIDEEPHYFYVSTLPAGKQSGTTQ
ncbi:hypothetical protein GALLN_00693 [Gallionellaceae bacterium]|nr:hypothetical protein GALLN_00693 [Gallionellaceae bacterium]